ncbi:MAG: hypothetical protein OES24_22060, partial [Acidimicrobiia bacterium]|nr:hypothetical protein [Acidimicrobiia bacterium]
MSRRTERAVLGWLAFAVAIVGLVVGVGLLTGGDAVDVTASSVGPVEATAPASPTGGADSGVGLAPDSLVVSTTVGSAATTSSSTTVDASDSSTVASADATSTSTSATGDDGGSSTTTASSNTTVLSGGDGSDTTATSVSSTGSTVAGSSTTVVSTELSDIEREIIRLTNELRANPAGPQRR